MGDSFTDRKTWPDEAQRLLAARRIAIDGFNLGVSGYGTTQEFRGRRMKLDTRPRQNISIDGEIAARTPVTVTVARGAIEVAAPRDGQFDAA